MAAIETRLLEFPINAHTAPGYLARPADGQAHPGVVVIQEWWGLGGGLALSTAAHHADLIGAAVAFYGRPLTASDAARLKVPVLGLYAEHDHGIPVEAVRAFEAEMEQQAVPHEVHIYPGTAHAFFNDTRPQIYAAAAAQDAWQKTLAWFRQYLVDG